MIYRIHSGQGFIRSLIWVICKRISRSMIRCVPLGEGPEINHCAQRFWPWIRYILHIWDPLPRSVDRICVVVMYQSNRSFNIPPGTPRTFDAFSCPGGREFDHHSLGVGNLIASLDVLLRGESLRRRQRRQILMNSKEKIAYLWRIGWKPKAYTSCVPVFKKVFKNDLYL